MAQWRRDSRRATLNGQVLQISSGVLDDFQRTSPPSKGHEKEFDLARLWWGWVLPIAVKLSARRVYGGKYFGTKKKHEGKQGKIIHKRS